MSPKHETSTPDPHAPVVIGVLGGIASGKSLVARLLAGATGVVLAADAFAREVLESPGLKPRLVQAFGPEALDSGGAVNRAHLAERVFDDPVARTRLEGWIHPLVRERIRCGLAEARAAGRGPIVLDVPLLLENDAQHGLVSECDFLVFVDADADVRDRRARERHGWAQGEVARRESTQKPLAEKRVSARHVIENRTDRTELEAAVAALLRTEGLL